MLTKKELAKRLGVSTSMIDKLMVQGVPHVKIGSAVRFDYDDVVDWLKRRRSTEKG